MEHFHQFLDKARQEKRSAIRWVKAWQKEFDLSPAKGNPGFRAAAFLVRRHQQQQQQQYYYYAVEEDPTVVVYCDDEDEEEEYFYNCYEEEADDSISSCSSAVVVVRTPPISSGDDDANAALHHGHANMEQKQPCSQDAAVGEAGPVGSTPVSSSAPPRPPSTLHDETQKKKAIVTSLISSCNSPLHQVVIRKRDQWRHHCTMRNKIVPELRKRTRQRSRYLQDYALVIRALLEQQQEPFSKLRSLSLFQETQRKSHFAMTTGMKELQTFYLLFDQVIQELQDNNETLELQGFQQLVIHELMERHVARAIHQERFQLIVGQLNQRFIMQEMSIMKNRAAAVSAGRQEQQLERTSSPSPPCPFPSDNYDVFNNTHHPTGVRTATTTTTTTHNIPQRPRRRQSSEWVQVLERPKTYRHPPPQQTRDPYTTLVQAAATIRSTPYEEEDDWVLCEESE